jgi:hypothetical protein
LEGKQQKLLDVLLKSRYEIPPACPDSRRNPPGTWAKRVQPEKASLPFAIRPMKKDYNKNGISADFHGSGLSYVIYLSIATTKNRAILKSKVERGVVLPFFDCKDGCPVTPRRLQGLPGI